MSMEEANKAIAGRWFTDFWGATCDLGIIDEPAAPDMPLSDSLHEPRRGREDIKAFMTGFRAAFPDLNFGAPRASSPKASSWWVGGKAAAPIRARCSGTFSQDRCRLRAVASCISPARRCCA